jgi:hypothetical protein
MHRTIVAALFAFAMALSPRLILAQAATEPTSPSPYVAPDPTSAEWQPPPDPTHALKGQLRRGRFMLAFGAALLAASATHMAIFGRRFSCYDHDEKVRYGMPPISAGIVAGVSVGLLIGGGVQFAGVPRAFRGEYRASPSKRAGVAGAALGMFAGASLLMTIATLPELMSCTN